MNATTCSLQPHTVTHTTQTRTEEVAPCGRVRGHHDPLSVPQGSMAICCGWSQVSMGSESGLNTHLIQHQASNYPTLGSLQGLRTLHTSTYITHNRIIIYSMYTHTERGRTYSLTHQMRTKTHTKFVKFPLTQSAISKLNLSC